MGSAGKARHRALRIGLTGGIASGKSTVAREFAGLGVELIDADVIAREVLAPGRPLLAKVVEMFGAKVLDKKGALDRAELRRRIFVSQADREALEALTHPPILAAMDQNAASASGPYVIMVIPLLVESGATGLVDRVLVIDCEAREQLRRLMQRDGIDATLARRMLAAQATREQRLAVADDVLNNSGQRGELAGMVARLDAFYRELANTPGAAPQHGLRLP